MPEPVRVPAGVWDQLLAHADRDAPDECCGLLEYDPASASVVAAHPLVSADPSPLRFALGSPDLLRLPEIEDRGLVPVIYHSHVRSVAEPSQTDLTFAANWPGVPWLIIGIAGPAPEVRWFEIEDGIARERPVERAAG